MKTSRLGLLFIAKCEGLATSDEMTVATRELVVDRLLKVPVRQHEWDALMSLGSSGGLKAVVRRLNASKRQEAADEFLKWSTNAAGEIELDLLRRRERERLLFMHAAYGDDLEQGPGATPAGAVLG